MCVCVLTRLQFAIAPENVNALIMCSVILHYIHAAVVVGVLCGVVVVDVAVVVVVFVAGKNMRACAICFVFFDRAPMRERVFADGRCVRVCIMSSACARL